MAQHVRDMTGNIVDDMRMLSHVKTDSRGNACWEVECIYCFKKKVMSRPNIKAHNGTTCVYCTNRPCHIHPEEEDKLVAEYESGKSIKTIVYDNSINTRTLYNVLKRKKIELRR